MTEEQRDWAVKRIRAKRAFWTHLTVYVAVNAFLVILWAVTLQGDFWPIWTMVGWGIGLAAHAISVFAGGSEITEERIEREIRGRHG